MFAVVSELQIFKSVSLSNCSVLGLLFLLEKRYGREDRFVDKLYVRHLEILLVGVFVKLLQLFQIKSVAYESSCCLIIQLC